MQKNFLILLLLVATWLVCESSFAQTDTHLLMSAQNSVPSFTKDLATLVNIDSGTGDKKGLAKAESFLVEHLKHLGAKVQSYAALPSVGKIVVGTFKGNGSKNIMLMIHYDTVFAAGESSKRPFKVIGNKAFGPGVADAKGGALIILHALAIARDRQFKAYNTLTVFFNPDEEKSSPGSRDMIQKLASEQDVVLSYEPPEKDQVVTATNGIAFVYLDIKGLAAHAGSAPEKGHNAAVELANQIMQLKDLGNPVKNTTVNWTVLNAGNRINIIPDTASAIADMRMSDLSEIERVQNDAYNIVQKKLIPDTVVTVRVEYRRSPLSKNLASDDLAVMANKIYQELGKSIEPVMARYGTDAGFAYNTKGSKPWILEGLGIIGERIHSSEESADLDSVTPRLYLTVRMLELLTQNIPGT